MRLLQSGNSLEVAKYISVSFLSNSVALVAFITCVVLEVPNNIGVILGYVSGSTLAFYLNRSWTFNAGSIGTIATHALKYAMTVIAGLILNLFLFWILNGILKLDNIVSELITILLTGISLFLMQKLLVFRPTKNRRT